MDKPIDAQQVTSHSDATALDLHSRMADALARLAACVRSVAQYGRSHPVIIDMVGSVQESLAELLVVQPTLVVAVGDSFLALESFPVEDNSGCLADLAKTLRERKVSELRLRTGVTHKEVGDFAEIVSMAPEEVLLRGGVETELNKREAEHIKVRSGLLPAELREGRDPADIYEEALLLVEEAMNAVQMGLQIPVPEIRGVVADSLRSLIHDDGALLALAGIRSYDRYLSEHSVSVCVLSLVLGKDLGLDPASNLELGVASMLHDVGKVFVPEEVVKKPARLSEEEWEQIRRHPAAGARALAGMLDLPALASTIALEHHVKVDGAGYPSLPGMRKPHLLSRLVAIVDTYDALTTDRPYRARWTAEQAIAWMLYETRGQYDRQLMARFAARAKLYPVGSLVRLKKGDYAIVVGGSFEHPRRPVLKIVTGVSAGDGAAPVVELAANTDPGLEIDAIAQPVEVLLPYADRLVRAMPSPMPS